MRLADIKNKLNDKAYTIIENEKIDELRPSQEKSIKAGLFEHKNLLVCTPTASGKTLIAEFAFLNNILKGRGKAVYIVPLKALATEKFKEFKRKYSSLLRVGISIGDLDSSDPYLANYDLIITTSEKLDSLIRHKADWVKDVSLMVVDEIHLLNDVQRGPTLEVVITIFKQIKKDLQILGLSATIGNPKELAEWLDAELVIDTWRPVELKKGICVDNEIEFY